MGRTTLAAIGCSGPVDELFVQGFLGRGIDVRVLARNVEDAARRHPGAQVVQGSMMEREDVARFVAGTDAAFLLTPAGTRNDVSLEVRAAESSIWGARDGGVGRLIYTSVLGPNYLKGPAILDAKYYIERHIQESGLTHTVLRCGAYMQDVFDKNLASLNQGLFPYPLAKDRRFSFTSQRDVPRFVAEEVLGQAPAAENTFNFVAPGSLSIGEVEAMISVASGREVRALDKYPAYYLLYLKYARAWLADDKASSAIPLIWYFDKHGCTDPGPTVGGLYPDFEMTTLGDHLRSLWLR